jgi:hypothetical protein
MDYISNALHILHTVLKFTNNKDKNVILDPLSTLIKLSLLKFSQINTKISIGDNIVTILDPGVFQGPYRFINGDGREDLHNLYIPIIKSLEWFIDINQINILYDFAKDGLENLKLSYPENSIICHTLDLYIYHLTIKTTKSFTNKEISENNLQNNLQNHSNEIHDFLKKLWSIREVHIIIELLLEYEKNKEEKHILKSILELTNAKELKLKDFLKKHFASL